MCAKNEKNFVKELTKLSNKYKIGIFALSSCSEGYPCIGELDEDEINGYYKLEGMNIITWIKPHNSHCTRPVGPDRDY